MEMRESNYEIMKHRMQEEFASYDLDQVASEWELKQDDQYLYVDFVAKKYRIDRRSGAVLCGMEGKQEADYNVSMTLFDILTRKRQHASGKVLPISSFSTVQSATMSGGSMFDSVSRRFDGHDEELAAACEQLGGKPYGKGDAAYIFPVFRDLQAALQFWDSDEDFPPALNLFCDKNILSFMHFETVMFMLIHVIERLEDELQKKL